MKYGLVSVIIPCYRCGATIKRALDSVAAQSLRPAEVILIEDGSDDDTLEQLYCAQGEHPKGWIKIIALEKNSGPSIARNTGWNAATQPYIAFLDADDSWHPQKIEIQYQWMAAHPEVALTSCGLRVKRDSTAEPMINKDMLVAKLVSKRKLLLSNQFATSAVMLKRELPNRFEHVKQHSEDYLLWLDICLAGHVCARLSAELAYFHKAPYGEGGLTGNLWAMEWGQLDNYRRMFKRRHVNYWQYLLLCTQSWMRFFKRYLVTLVRNIRR